ncbi:KH domain-containing, RNA-binding, signal transduction-associated protein 2-like [Pocillopora damicornis]|uniref:KH domain-containing, RNA-binding, signal transduction-associated protein 2-like n=1 Tax=Pocillopora damicornis TaxID=46731 RepID=UPI000F54EFD5|nr:KH domain-containing, RNA-binding, signal transduction-associated protein 2-like [Pocillopora damicornis]
MIGIEPIKASSHSALFGECSLRHERHIWLAPFCIFCSGCSSLISAGILLYFSIMAVEGGYLTELLTEKDNLDPSFVHSMRLLTEEINKVQTGGALPAVQALKKPKIEKTTNGNTLSPVSENVPPSSQVPAAESPEVPVATRPPPQTHHFRRPADVFDSKLYQPTKLMEKVFIPVKEYPKFNFVGKLLGPRGNTFKRLQASTGTKMSILGKGSMRDKEKEEELRSSGDAKYAHLDEDLHVLIEVEAPPGQAHARLGLAIEEIKKFLVPENNDEIHQEQMREMAILNGMEEPVPAAAPVAVPAPVPRGRPHPRGVPHHLHHPAHHGRGTPVPRTTAIARPRGPTVGHVTVSAAARSAAGLGPSSPTVAHAAPRAAAVPGDPYGAVHTLPASVGVQLLTTGEQVIVSAHK